MLEDCLCKVGKSPIPTLNKVKTSWIPWAWKRTLMWPWDLDPLQDQVKGAQGNRPNSRWASITYLVLPDFSSKLYPSQISMVGMDSLIHQTKKIFNLKFL
jgi:hypothetical protein